MPVIKREDFGTQRAPEWAKVVGGVGGLGYWTAEKGQQVELHFHDAEEFWFILEGKARVMTDGNEYVVTPGDVVCTHKGEEHGILEIVDVPYAHFWVECNLRGRRRRGHLHRPEDEAA